MPRNLKAAGAFAAGKGEPDVDIVEARSCLPQYTLHEPLTAGAQGDVFLATSEAGAQVVVKIVSRPWADRGEREIRALQAVKHPSIVTIVDSGTLTGSAGTLPYVVTEFIEGDSLRRRLDESTFDVSCAARLISSIALGLDALWTVRIVHRDIKPSNIIVRPDGSGVLLDLGVARCLDMTALTGYGSLGTEGYLSPEQARGEPNLTTKSDVYSLGVTAYEAIVGDHPFGRDQGLMLRSVMPPSVPSSAPCSVTVRSLLAAMMEPLASMRPMPAQIVSELAREVA